MAAFAEFRAKDYFSTPSSKSGGYLSNEKENNETRLSTPGSHPHYSSKKSSTRRFGTLRSTLRRGVTNPRRASLRLKRCGSKQAGMITQSSVAGALSVELEHLKRKQSQLHEEGGSLCRKLDDELKLRTTFMKTISSTASSLSAQLESAKDLLASNYRIKAYLESTSRLQLGSSPGTFRDISKTFVSSSSTDIPLPPPGVISISNIRIPLMWKDTDYFKNKGDYRRFSTFCLVRVGQLVSTTALVSNIDRSVTDITFDDVITLERIPHDFRCHLELYSYEHLGDLSIASAQVKLKKRLSDLSNSAFKRLSRHRTPMKEKQGGDKSQVPTFTLLAETVLCLSDAQKKSSSFDLVLNAEASQLLPLFGSFMCDFSTSCNDLMSQSVSGWLSLSKQGTEDRMPYWCSLCSGQIRGWRSQIEAHISTPIITIPVMKESVIRKLHEEKTTLLTIENGTNEDEVWYLYTEQVDEWWQELRKLILSQVVWGVSQLDSNLASSSSYYLRRKTTSL